MGALIPPYRSADAELVDLFERRAAPAANEGVAISTQQRVGDRRGAGGTVEFGGRVGLGHYFAAPMEATVIVLVFSSSVPMTVTFLPANFAGVVWSLST